MISNNDTMLTKHAARVLDQSVTRIHTMLNSGIPKELKPSRFKSESNGRMIYSFKDEDIKLLSRAFKLKKEMSYRELKDFLEQEIALESMRKAGKRKSLKSEGVVEPSEDLINIDNEDGQLLVSSREVARNFNKRHDSLLRDINNTINDMESPQDCGHLFIKSKYTNEQNKQEYQEYLLTRDGFSLLVMGFTGKEALQWKLKYIETFNKMEKSLKSNKASYMIEDPIERAKAWIKEQEKTENLKLQTKQQQQIIGELKSKSDYTDRILQSNDLVTITQISKDYGMTGQAMNTLLNELGVQFKASGQWLLYREYQDKGYTHSQTVEYIKADGDIGTNMHTKWTQKGRLFLYDLLKEKEVLPLIER